MSSKTLSMLLSLIVALIMSVSMPIRATYNDNMSGEVTHVMTYTSGLILFRLKNQPGSHPSCTATYFAIATDTPEAAAQRMYSRLLVAYASKQPVNIGFDNLASCGNNYIRVYRVG